MRERRKTNRRSWVRLAKDSIEAQTKVSTQTKGPNRQHLVLNLLDSIFQRRSLILRRSHSRRGCDIFLFTGLWFAACGFGRQGCYHSLLISNEGAHFIESPGLLS